MGKSLFRTAIFLVGSQVVQGAWAADVVGIPVCDDFITRYEACLKQNVPAAYQATLKEQISKWRAEWTKVAKDPGGKAMLEQVCKATLDQIKPTMKPMGCDL